MAVLRIAPEDGFGRSGIVFVDDHGNELDYDAGVEMSLVAFRDPAEAGAGGILAGCGDRAPAGEAGYTGALACCTTGAACNDRDDGGLECDD